MLFVCYSLCKTGARLWSLIQKCKYHLSIETLSFTFTYRLATVLILLSPMSVACCWGREWSAVLLFTASQSDSLRRDIERLLHWIRLHPPTQQVCQLYLKGIDWPWLIKYTYRCSHWSAYVSSSGLSTRVCSTWTSTQLYLSAARAVLPTSRTPVTASTVCPAAVRFSANPSVSPLSTSTASRYEGDYQVFVA